MKLFHKKAVLVTLFGVLLSLSIVVNNAVRNHRVYADFPGGLPNKKLPNNGSWENGSTIKQSPPYLVVAHGADEGPRLNTGIYYPALTDTVNITIQDACDSNGNVDVDGSVGRTVFYFMGTSSVINHSGDYGSDVRVSQYGPADWHYVEVECNSGGDANFDVTIDPSVPTETIYTANGPRPFRRLDFEALALDEANPCPGSSCVDYENSFRLIANNDNVITTYMGQDATTDKSFAYTGIYNRNPAKDSCSLSTVTCYWQTSIAYAPPCDWTPGKAADINFFDDDANPGNYQSAYNVRWTITRYPRDGSGSGAQVASGHLTGGNNADDSIPNIGYDPAYSYQLDLADIYIRNSIQISMPWSQINAVNICPPPDVTIAGRVWDKSTGDAILTPVLFETCSSAGQVWSSSDDGFVRFTIKKGDGFCLRAITKLDGYDSHVNKDGYLDSVNLWPWSSGYYTCPASSPDSPYTGSFCPYSRYEYQKAGVTNTDQKGPDGVTPLDRDRDDGYDFVYTPTRTIEGRIWDRTNDANVNGVVVKDCNGNTATTGADPKRPGFYDITLDWNQGFCLRVQSVPNGYHYHRNSGDFVDALNVWPWSSPYYDCPASSPPGPPYTGAFCPYGTYEYQRAGLTDTGQKGPNGFTPLDRDRDNGYDFALIPERPPAPNITVQNCSPLGTTPKITLTNVTDPDSPSHSLTTQLYEGGNYVAGADKAGPNVSFDLSDWNDYGTHTFKVKVIGVDENNNPDGRDYTSPDEVIGPCAPPTCGNSSTLPANPQPNDNFKARVNFNYAPHSRGRPISKTPPAGNPSIVMHLKIGGNGGLAVIYDQDTDYVPYNPVPGYPANAGSATTGNLTAASPGQYDVHMTLGAAGAFGGLDCGPSVMPPVVVSNDPYVKIFGNDVLAGSGFNQVQSNGSTLSCTANSTYNVRNSARIHTFVNGGSASNYDGGSSVQFAAQAMAAILEFASASQRKGMPNYKPPTGLSFANTTGGYGGNFRQARCAPDFYNTTQNSPALITTDLLDITTLPDNQQTLVKPATPGGKVQLTNGGGGGNFGVRHTVYVDGDAWVSTNVIYTNTGGWGNISNIPYFTLVARGNIYIGTVVNTLDGLYIAQPVTNGSHGGEIYTCVENGNVVDAASLYAACLPNKLTVHGAFIAKRVKFLRTSGTVNTATSSEDRLTNNAAEVFDFSPEMYLGHPVFKPSSKATGLNPDSLVDLPPVF